MQLERLPMAHKHRPKGRNRLSLRSVNMQSPMQIRAASGIRRHKIVFLSIFASWQIAACYRKEYIIHSAFDNFVIVKDFRVVKDQVGCLLCMVNRNIPSIFDWLIRTTKCLNSFLIHAIQADMVFDIGVFQL